MSKFLKNLYMCIELVFEEMKFHKIKNFCEINHKLWNFSLLSQKLFNTDFCNQNSRKKCFTPKNFIFKSLIQSRYLNMVKSRYLDQIEIEQAKAAPSTIFRFLLNFVKNDNFGIPGILEGFILTLSKHWIPKNGSFDSNWKHKVVRTPN